MHFKSLELIGFKSFAEKTKLNFEPGVTAIIGPNGCGKSNIADGVRWVLGEQSTKSLRASKMEDVIFNGTDSKEPINFAEVSLTLSNEKRILPIDYDEVTISRRLFRSGDTEYLLNKTPVRLKDISELLMGTGIGTESYSIIEQGKMDMILSSKPEDRRYVFEEASGITKYKAKKKEAMRKLEQTEQNLLRINDIIQEVKRQISSIERQARKAERYKADFDRLKELEVKLSNFEYRNLKTGEKTYAAEKEDLRQRETDKASEASATSSIISNHRTALDGINQKISELKNRSLEMSNALDMNTHKIAIDRERIEEARQAKENLEREIASINEKIRVASALVENLKRDLERIASARTDKKNLANNKEMTLKNISKEIENSELRVKTSKVQVVDHISKETKIKNELIKLGADVQNRKARQRRLEIEGQTVEKELASSNGAMESVLKEYKDAESKILELKTSLESKRKIKGDADSGIKELEEGLAGQENKRAALRSKIEFLEDLIKRHEGFKTAVKSLLSKMEDSNHGTGGVLGVVADIIKVERGFEEAVSAFLGDDAQLIVTEKEADIASAIGYLKENKLGKASFISLETVSKVRPGGISGPYKALDGARPLRGFVRTEARYGTVIDHLFADAYIADSIDGRDASSLATIVTKSGTIFEKGKISGGSASEKDELLVVGRRDRLDAIKGELKDIEGSIDRISGFLEEKRALGASLESEINLMEEALHTEDINFANISMRKESQESDMRKLKDETQLVKLELDEINETIAELTRKGEEFNAELNDIEKNKSELQLWIDQSQNAISDKRIEKDRLSIEITTLKAELAATYKEEENAANNLAKEESALSELTGSLELKAQQLSDLVSRAAALGEEIVALEAQNKTLSSELELLNASFSGTENEKSDLADKLGIAEIQLGAVEKEVESLRNQIRDLDVKFAELNYKKTNLKDRIQQAYKVDLEELHMEPEDGVDWDASRSQVAELKEKLEGMGPVNLVAIEEHKELEERHAFLMHQQEDLVNAKESLLKAIQKINKTTKELFIDTFQKIQVEFKSFFRMLFGGGQAELLLIDEQDVLESGIEIVARPPGKKLQNITLLSGGERALTAIALLFSIFKVKPSPFCVLDEIDAPLDESNVTRFSSVLRDFLKMSQFIIITHNKRTIELADVMYGITMQERGVSKIVSVKFLDKKTSEEPKTEALV